MGASIPAAWNDAPEPGSPRSSTRMERPCSASRQAIPRPMEPAPTTMVSTTDHIPSRALSRSGRRVVGEPTSQPLSGSSPSARRSIGLEQVSGAPSSEAAGVSEDVEGNQDDEEGSGQEGQFLLEGRFRR